jgi:3-deoxy-D-arabino-heptulosonate 7-phosphate (DAHP) synthase class II
MRRQILGVHSPTGHEALSLAMTLPMLRIDPETGELALLSGDEPWGGARTNDPESLTMKVLGGIINSIGVKLRAGDEWKIPGLEQLLNPNREPGKVIYNIRVGEDITAMRAIAREIRNSDPEAGIAFDGHGSTTVVTNPGTGKDVKVRHVPTLIRHTQVLADVVAEHGLSLHGVHVETTWDDSRLECTDELDQLPTHPGNVDPGMNPRQFRTYLEEVKGYLPH